MNLVEQVGGAKILGDANELQQVVLNLAINAFRHSNAGGTLTVSATLPDQNTGGVALIEFSDNGSGIPAEQLPHIFEAGFSTTGQSPGLGLTVCQLLVEQHGGSIRVQSEVGRGTTFSLEFPLA